jgi:mutator protein MutT
MDKPVHAVSVALVHRDGRWLVAQRRNDAHLGGLWEFPGGKREPGETPAQAAVRELLEECGVTAAAENALPELTCDYGDRLVRITPVLCRWLSGEARALGNAACRWASEREILELRMPAINATMVRMMREYCARNPGASG